MGKGSRGAMDARARGVPDTEKIELKGFQRTLAETLWLLLVLILVYLVIPGVEVEVLPIAAASAAFALMIIGFRYLNLFTPEARWKLVVETLAMTLLIAFVIWHAGAQQTGLVNLYLLPIVFAALTLGRSMTLAVVALIIAFYLYSSHALLGRAIFGFEMFGHVMLQLGPFVLVAYLASMLAADMNFSRRILRELSETDGMTAVANMRAFYIAFERELIRAQRERTGLTVMMIDADNLKQTNDRYGHEAGNRLIVGIVDSMHRVLRRSDLIARYGGDEFIVLLPNTGPQAAREAAERLRESIERMAIEVGGTPVRATVSIGYASYPDHAHDLQELIALADQAMYRSKKAGRNRVTRYGDGAYAEMGNAMA
ncbi:diguanylate cyclase (GGDEF domain) [Thioalkalivibrio nitratireducens DSM 14787]|uniref:diguanylate cyclase n=1 Tax=Thioalkalivibrio nitratireducens (strain DSM 14787 / UNIQEM 213 / ALEN2) TaxID=1255043 RepID=L0DT92_THIND|nr:diguanylate cyclase (GGDEF domain) [Thioalkalivibrio nitratireducens DSM 14787]